MKAGNTLDTTGDHFQEPFSSRMQDGTLGFPKYRYRNRLCDSPRVCYTVQQETETELKCRDEDPLMTRERLAAPFCL